ncbi:uncharacterized protein V6R79_007166 [Siganus canaliculatus]
MAEQISQRRSTRPAVERRSIRKHQESHCIPPHPDREPSTDSVTPDSSCGSVCASTGLLLDSTEDGILYLNPQAPDWSLVERFAELSSGKEKGLHSDQVHSCPELFPCTGCVKNSVCESDEVPVDTVEKTERESSKCDAAAVKQRSFKLKQRNAEEYSPAGAGNKTNTKKVSRNAVKEVLKKREDNKIARLLVAMKKRSGVNTEQRPFKCPHCHWAFNKLCNLQSHLQTHSGLKPHVCDVCGKAYSHQGTLQQHKRLHTGERPYHCPFCVKTYIWSSDYRKHIRTHTGEKPYVCATCGKDFIRSSDLRKHERNMHTNDKPFPCSHCDKTFNKPLSLKRHERKHLGERPFSCPDCGKAFALVSRMVEHQKIHAGVRPYICSVCSKCFTKSSNLMEHEAIHSGVRPHKCAECGVAFLMASRLVRHQYIHNREKPHTCTGCGRNFNHLPALKLHQEQVCPGRIFVCMECDKSFQCAAKLAQHVLNHGDKKV